MTNTRPGQLLFVICHWPLVIEILLGGNANPKVKPLPSHGLSKVGNFLKMTNDKSPGAIRSDLFVICHRSFVIWSRKRLPTDCPPPTSRWGRNRGLGSKGSSPEDA